MRFRDVISGAFVRYLFPMCQLTNVGLAEYNLHYYLGSVNPVFIQLLTSKSL